MDMEKVLSKIQKGRDCIFIFDDISFITELMKSTDLAQMQNDFAVLRHKWLGESAKMITFNIIHY